MLDSSPCRLRRTWGCAISRVCIELIIKTKQTNWSGKKRLSWYGHVSRLDEHTSAQISYTDHKNFHILIIKTFIYWLPKLSYTLNDLRKSDWIDTVYFHILIIKTFIHTHSYLILSLFMFHLYCTSHIYMWARQVSPLL